MPEQPPDDPLADLRERILATEEAAQRLAGEAGRARAQERAGGIPPRGWATPGDHAARTGELEELSALLGALRSLVPDELQGQLREVIRQVLLLLRALIDWWVERMEAAADGTGGAGSAPARPVQDIPID